MNEILSTHVAVSSLVQIIVEYDADYWLERLTEVFFRPKVTTNEQVLYYMYQWALRLEESHEYGAWLWETDWYRLYTSETSVPLYDVSACLHVISLHGPTLRLVLQTCSYDILDVVFTEQQETFEAECCFERMDEDDSVWLVMDITFI